LDQYFGVLGRRFFDLLKLEAIRRAVLVADNRSQEPSSGFSLDRNGKHEHLGGAALPTMDRADRFWHDKRSLLVTEDLLVWILVWVDLVEGLAGVDNSADR
jgi:hypothetical protein